MRTFFGAALAFGTMSSVALAAPVALTDTEMDTVTAGALVDVQLSTLQHDVYVTAGRTQSRGDSTDVLPCLIWDIDGANGVTGMIHIMFGEPRGTGD